MVHRQEIDGYPGTLADLAQALGDLRYDALASFLRALAAKLEADADADAGRSRPRLSGELNLAAEAVERAWRICAPRMGE